MVVAVKDNGTWVDEIGAADDDSRGHSQKSDRAYEKLLQFKNQSHIVIIVINQIISVSAICHC